jgi:protein-tyrosine sulfotransferase
VNVSNEALPNKNGGGANAPSPSVFPTSATGGLSSISQVGGECGAPIFVLCTARSGSTLLRSLLSAHPEIVCPPETNLSDIMIAIQRSAWLLTGETTFSDERLRSDRARALTRLVADGLLGDYAKAQRKSRWCDKSLSTAEHAPMVAEVFPDATFICLVRESTDTIASLLEASPFGFPAFGLEPYIRASPGNLVTALGAYWADKTEAVCRFEATGHPRTLRIRYEDLVADTAGCLKAICDIADLDWSASYFTEERVFADDNLGLTCGDAKIRYRKGVDTGSVGRGWTIPLDLLAPPLLERVNVLHAQLGYRRLDPARPFEALPSEAQRHADVAAIDEIDARLRHRLKTLPPTGREGEPSAVKLAVRDANIAWKVDYFAGTVSPAKLDVDDLDPMWAIVTDSETIVGMADGRVNPAVAMRQGRLQAFHPREDQTVAQQISQVERFLALVR